MIQKFCDICGKELEINMVVVGHPRPTIVYKAPNGKIVYAEVICGVDGWNRGELCGDCLLQAITMGERRMS